METEQHAFIGTNLKYLRKNRHLSQHELADLLHIKRSNIAAYESKRTQPRAQLVVAIADFFHVTVRDLICQDLRQPRPAFPAERLAEQLPALQGALEGLLAHLAATPGSEHPPVLAAEALALAQRLTAVCAELQAMPRPTAPDSTT